MARTPKTIEVQVVTQRELELGQENQALRAYLQQADRDLEDLLSGLKMWMVGWRDDLQPMARKQMEDMIEEFTRRSCTT